MKGKGLFWRVAAAVSAVILLAEAVGAARTVKPAYVLVCAEGAVGQLLDLDGNVLRQLVFNEQGQLAMGPVLPGTYALRVGDATAIFTLRTNAAISQVSGDGWTDGEILYVGQRETGSLTILYDGPWRWTLEGETADEAIPDLEADRCVFGALPLGAYVLRGETELPILLTRETPDPVLDLRKRDLPVTGPLG